MKRVLPGQGDTVGAVLDRNKGVGPGFDLLRVLLALMVFYVHTKSISQVVPTAGEAQALATLGGSIAVAVAAHTSAWDGWFRPILVAILPMFFALSGFLVAGSALRIKRVSTFLAFRVLRLWPALITEITLSALILGPLFTTLDLREYFSNWSTYSYFGNLVGDIRYVLPGVFEHHGTVIVNGNLRTLPAEFLCYAAAAVLMVFKVLYSRVWFTSAMILATCIVVPLNMFSDFAVMPMFVSDLTLVYYFMAGVTLFHWRDKLTLQPWLALAAGAIAFLFLEFKHTVFLAPLPLTYCTVYFGMLTLPKIPLLRKGDYSYGIYLYGFPICQACIAVMPFLIGHRLALFCIGGLFTCLFAAFSWHVIEKPSLSLKRLLPISLFPPAKMVPVLQSPGS